MNKLFLLPVVIAVLWFDPVSTETPVSVRKNRNENEPYVAYYENGNKKFTVTFRKNKATGNWKSWYPSGMLCDSGRFAGNVPDGEWKGWYPDGSLRYSWHLSATKLTALKDELLRQPKMKVFAISQKPVSEAVKYYQSDFLFKQPVSKPRVALRSQMVHTKYYDLNSIEKKVERNTVEGNNDYVPPFPEMLLHGEFTSFYPGGKVKEEGVYINGLREGMWEEHATTGEKARGSYHHGYKSGEWRTYSKAGKLVSYTHYNNKGEVTETHQFSVRR